MIAVLKRELSAYFKSVLGYVYLAIFLLFSGIYFFVTCLYGYGSSNLTYVFGNLFVIVIFLVPILTMRLWSEEKKQKTDQLLLTAPVKLTSVALGKYLAALCVFAIGLLITLVYAGLISFFADPGWPLVITNFFGLLLLGSTLISIGLFISSLTENQLIAAIVTFAIGLFIMMMDSLSSFINIQFVTNIFNALSFNKHYSNLTSGVLNINDIIFFLSASFIFVFLNIRVLDKKRWS